LETSFPTCYQDRVKINFKQEKGKNRKISKILAKKPENIRILEKKKENIRILHKNSYLRKGYIQENPKFEHINQSIYTDHERMPRISTGKPIH
jgi:hypothetical protein